MHLIIPQLQFGGNTLFIDNSASNGTAIYLENVFTVSTDDNAYVQFINNSAEQNGGAMYINLVSEHCNVFNTDDHLSNICASSFINNSAGIAGNSIYFSIPQACQIVTDISNTSSLLYYPNKFDYTQPKYNRYPPVVTSPYSIKLISSAFVIHNSSIDYPMQQKLSKILGEPIQFTASVLDYFNNITEPVVFSINCKNCDNAKGGGAGPLFQTASKTFEQTKKQIYGKQILILATRT